jgi:hypothetical protein
MNLDLAGRGFTVGTPSEPSVAASGNLIFYTENFSTGYSTDGGLSWTTINPYRDLPSVFNGFCCDQVVIYVPQVNRFVWLLQYWADATNNAAIRMVVVSPAQLRAGNPSSWRRFDFTSGFFNQAGVGGLDQPDLAVGSRSIYMTVDQMNTAQKVTSSHVVRIGVGELLKSSMNLSWADADRPYLHPVQHVRGRAYFVQHRSTTTLRVYYWDENSNQIAWKDVDHSSIADANWTSTTPSPGGADWLNRANNSGGYRIRGATLAGRQLWLAWSAGRDATLPSGGTKNLFKQPHIDIARIDGGTLDLRGEDHIANDNHGFARPVLDTNNRGEVVMSFAWGGNKWYASQGVSFLTGRREFWASLENDADPPGSATNPHGDYGTIRANWPSSDCVLTVAVGWQNRQGVARLVTFDREGNEALCTPRPEFLEPSTLQLTCPSGLLTPSNPLFAQGSIQPPRPGVPVTVSWQAPDGTVVTHVVVTDPGSTFFDAGPVGQAGVWRLKASWPGDRTYLSAQASCSFSVSVPSPGKAASAITLQCPSDTTIQYTTISASGRIDPPHPNTPVAVTYKLLGTPTAITHNVSTDGGGTYNDSYEFDIDGHWEIQAAWSGDPTYGAAVSGVCPLTVFYRPR